MKESIFDNSKPVWSGSSNGGSDPVASGLAGLSKAVTLEVTINTISAYDGEINLFSLEKNDGSLILRLYQDKGDIKFYLWTDAAEKPLILEIPGFTDHFSKSSRVYVRYFGYRVELWVDGVLADEEWPMGDIDFKAGATVRIGDEQGHAKVSAVVWDYVLDNSELIKMAGGIGQIRVREEQLLGKRQNRLQYWKPYGFNTGVGDCMPFFHAGRFHLFYLIDRHNHNSKWGLGAHQWAHVSSADLIHWEEHEMALPITEEWEGSICTGSVIFHDGRYYAFYAVRTVDGSPAKLSAAVSEDGIHFDKTQKYFTLSDRYYAPSARDPEVFLADDGLFHMLVTTYDLKTRHGRNGCLAHLISKDLLEWEEKDPFIVPGFNWEPECCNWFKWNDWYYLILSDGGTARYRMSKQPFGPWSKPESDIIDAAGYFVPKTAAFKNGRRIMAGFVTRPGVYGGKLVFREVTQSEDGLLGLKIPEELLPGSRNVITTTPQPISGEVVLKDDSIALTSHEGISFVKLTESAENFHLHCSIKPEPETALYGLQFYASDDAKEGYEITFDIARRQVSLRKIGDGSFGFYNLDCVEGLNREVSLNLTVCNGVADICINSNRTMVALCSKTGCTDILFLTQYGSAEFTNCHIENI